MEHLLNGAAAVEEKSKSGDENAPPVATSGAANAARSATPPLVDTKCEPAERVLSPPLPKLPPISSLTQLRGVPPSLQPPAPVKAVATPRQTTGSHATHDEGLCRYRNKLCMHPRALKRNGELHNLCEKHRAKANQNQRKLESKRRVQKRQTHRHSVQHAPAPPRAYQLTPAGAAPVAAPTAMHMHPSYQYQQPQQSFHLQAPPLRGQAGSLPSLAQLHRPPPSSSPSPAHPAYPYNDVHNYPPYSR